MALTWDLTKIKDHDTICFIETETGEVDEDGKPLVRLNPVTEALIWTTMGVGIGRITEDNAGEFYARAYIMERANGAMLTKQGEPAYLTIEDVQAHIGLSCNVSYETRDEWALRHFGGDDGLISYGEKLADEDDRYERADIRAGLLRSCGDILLDHGNANVARVGNELHEQADRAERFGHSTVSSLARAFRSAQKAEVTEA